MSTNINQPTTDECFNIENITVLLQQQIKLSGLWHGEIFIRFYSRNVKTKTGPAYKKAQHKRSSVWQSILYPLMLKTLLQVPENMKHNCRRIIGTTVDPNLTITYLFSSFFKFKIGLTQLKLIKLKY